MSLTPRSIPIVTGATLGVITIAAWVALLAGTPMNDAGAFLVAWVVMMVAMMLPSTLPMVLLFRLSSEDGVRGQARTALFVAGYFIVWSAIGVIVLAGQVVLSGADTGSRALGVAGVLLAAGAYQFTPLKATCLRACQNPADFLVRRWRTGNFGALRLGIDHGLYCLGCCWALMAVLVVAGGMGIAWVTLIALIVLTEKLVPRAVWFGRAVGVAFALSAIAVALRPELAAPTIM